VKNISLDLVEFTGLMSVADVQQRNRRDFILELMCHSSMSALLWPIDSSSPLTAQKYLQPPYSSNLTCVVAIYHSHWHFVCITILGKYGPSQAVCNMR
jgi:hypothetical protein